MNSKDMNINRQPENDNTIVQTPEDMTIAQMTNPINQVENDRTIVQTPEDMTIAQMKNLINQVENDNTIVQTPEDMTIAQMTNPILEAEVTVVQNHNNTTDRTVVQHSNSPIHNSIHNPIEQKVYPAKSPLSTNLDRQSNFSQSSISAIVRENRGNLRLFYPSMFRNMFRNIFGISGLPISRFTSITRRFLNPIWRKINFKQPQSRLLLDSRERTLEQTSSNSLNRSTASNERLSSEQYQKKLRELDLCRLNFAKELARNSNFRKAIAEAEQISQMSHFFKDAQMLIQSWKQF